MPTLGRVDCCGAARRLAVWRRAPAAWPARARRDGCPPAGWLVVLLAGGFWFGGVGLGAAPPLIDRRPLPQATSPHPPLRPAPLAASLQGRVVAADSTRPLAGARVEVIDVATDERRTTSTGPDGRYAFEALPPGRYLVSAAAEGYVPHVFGQQGWLPDGSPLDLTPGAAAEISFRLQRAATIGGRVVDPSGAPLVGARVEALRPSLRADQAGLVPLSASVSDAQGLFRLTGLPPGAYYLAATVPAASDAPRAAPAYFPGVPWIGEATRVRVPAGGRLDGLIFSVRPSLRVRVSGRLVTDGARPLRAGAVIMSPQTEAAFAIGPTESARLEPDGRFTFIDVPAGRYLVRAHADTDPLGTALFGTFVVTVEDQDVTNLEIALRPGVVLAGALAFEGTAPPPAVVAQLVVRAPLAGRLVSGTERPGLVQPDGTFRLEVLPGERLVRVENVPDGWILKAVYFQGRDVTDRPIAVVEGQPIGTLRIVLTDRVPLLTGAVRAPDDRPLAGYGVLALPVDRALRHPRSRHVRLVPVDPDGRYRIRDLPPGQYFVGVVDGLDEADLWETGVTERLVARARLVQLQVGRTTVADLLIPTDPAPAEPVASPDRISVRRTHLCPGALTRPTVP